jgi:hypothetical protein
MAIEPVNFDTSGFYDAGLLKQVAVNLFYGWGYNFYRKENQLRADDHLVRAKAAWLLGLARSAVDVAEQAFRRERIPPPSRANPYPDPKAVADCQALERFGGAIGQVSGRLHAQPTPENDRITQRYRSEMNSLQRLAASDESLIGQCELLKSAVEGRDGAWVLEHLPSLEEGLRAIGRTLEQRQAVLLSY